jgi:hypothetical protein
MTEHVAEIRRQFPGAARCNVAMIALAYQIPVGVVRYRCRQAFPSWAGHYRFEWAGPGTGWALSGNDLADLLERIL